MTIGAALGATGATGAAKAAVGGGGFGGGMMGRDSDPMKGMISRALSTPQPMLTPMQIGRYQSGSPMQQQMVGMRNPQGLAAWLAQQQMGQQLAAPPPPNPLKQVLADFIPRYMPGATQSLYQGV